MKIIGANLGEKEVEYHPLSRYQFFKDERQDVVNKLEQLYMRIQDESKRTEVKPFPQKDGKADLQPGMITHRCASSIESVRAISQYGILASEWFGQIESEREGVFCSFVDRVHSEDSEDWLRKDRAKRLNNQRLKTIGRNLVLFFDSSNPVMQELLHMDYFEYERIRQQSPEKLQEIYSKDELEILGKIISPYSPCSRDYHINNTLPYCDWSAIPGGIPATLVNGICTKTREYSKEYIEEVSKLFPNATIFNGDLEIIHTPTPEKEKNAKKEDKDIEER